MSPLRIIRPGVFLAGLLVAFLAPLHAGEDGFSAPPTPAQPAVAPAARGLEELDRTEGESGSPTRPAPRERPRLAHSELLSETGRLRVHGGMSFTVGGGSGGSFHGASTWVSYHDPVTGISLGFAFSQMSGNGYPGVYPGLDGYPRRYSSGPVYPYSALPPLQPTAPDPMQPPLFIRTPATAGRERAR